MSAFEARTEETLADLIKQRTILNVRKKRRKKLYDALADAEALALAARLYGEGLSGMPPTVKIQRPLKVRQEFYKART